MDTVAHADRGQEAYKHGFSAWVRSDRSRLQRVQTVARTALRAFAERRTSCDRAAYAFRELGLGRAVPWARRKSVRANMHKLAMPENAALKIVPARLSSSRTRIAAEYPYRPAATSAFCSATSSGWSIRTANVFAACMMACVTR